MTNQPNPLSNHFRSPKLFLKLPSGGSYYSNDIIEMPENGELPVFPMTSKDEMLMKNPDALLNGEATIQLIKSCIPNVKNPLNCISPDVEAMLVAITGASNNDEINLSAQCPECDEMAEVIVSAEAILETQKPFEGNSTFNIGDDLVIEVQPFTYNSTVQAGISTFQSTRSLQSISELTDDMDRLKMFNDSFVKLAATNFQLLVDSVRKITIKGDEDIVVTDKKQILEFLENCDSAIGKKIDDTATSLQTSGIEKEATFECEKCKKTFDATVGFDPVNFFTGS